MIRTSITVNRVKSVINDMEKTNDYAVTLGYTNDIKPVPITKPIVAVSLKECNIGKKKTKIDESGQPQETNSRDSLTVVSVDIYLPYAYKQTLGVQIFDEIAHCLFNHEWFDISEANCEEAHYDVASQAILIRSSFAILDSIAP